MNITIGSNTYDNVFYDADADVLYLHKGDPGTAVDWSETPEGPALRFGPDGELVGLTIVSPRRILDRYGEIKLTLPVREEHVALSAAQVDRALIPA